MEAAPSPLRPGDCLAVVAPSGAFDAERYARGVATLRDRGYVVREYLPSTPWRYLAGTDEERLRLLHAAFADEEARAVIAARGGYGAMRLLPFLDWDRLAASPKPLIGFSDVTALHLPLQLRGRKGVHGPVLTQLAEQPEASMDRFFDLLASDAPPPPLSGRSVVPGVAEGRLVGGCLSLLAALVGTPFFPPLEGAILLLEEVGERPYRLDRLFTQLRLAGALDRVAGFAIGELTDCDGNELKGAALLDEWIAELGKPAVSHLPIGHGAINCAVPLGARVAIRDGALHFAEGLW